MAFIKNLDRHHKVILLVGGVSLLFDNDAASLIKKFTSSAGKIYKLRTEK